MTTKDTAELFIFRCISDHYRDGDSQCIDSIISEVFHFRFPVTIA